jgi:NIPSNAP
VLIDLRTYRVRPGKLPQELDLYAKQGFASQLRHLGPPGRLSAGRKRRSQHTRAFVAFEDAGDRARRRAAMASDPEWQNYLKLADEAGYLVDQRNTLMVLASFAPIKR